MLVFLHSAERGCDSILSHRRAAACYGTAGVTGADRRGGQTDEDTGCRDDRAGDDGSGHALRVDALPGAARSDPDPLEHPRSDRWLARQADGDLYHAGHNGAARRDADRAAVAVAAQLRHRAVPRYVQLLDAALRGADGVHPRRDAAGGAPPGDGLRASAGERLLPVLRADGQQAWTGPAELLDRDPYAVDPGE